MVKLDLEINEIVGLAELERIDEKKLKKFLKAASKDELEDYIVGSVMGKENHEPDESTEEVSDEDNDL